MKKVCLVNGSLRGKQASSSEFLKDIDLRLPDTEYSKTVINVKAKIKDSYPEDILQSLAGADAIIFMLQARICTTIISIYRFLVVALESSTMDAQSR